MKKRRNWSWACNWVPATDALCEVEYDIPPSLAIHTGLATFMRDKWHSANEGHDLSSNVRRWRYAKTEEISARHERKKP